MSDPRHRAFLYHNMVVHNILAKERKHKAEYHRAEAERIHRLLTNSLIKFRDLQKGQRFRFLHETKPRYVCQVGRSEMYCPIIDQNTMGHSMAGGEEVYPKFSDQEVELV